MNPTSLGESQRGWGVAGASSHRAPKLTHLPGSFKTKQTSWGPMVISIHGLAANTDDRTYWEFLSGQDSLQEGGQPRVGGTGGTRGVLPGAAMPQPHACPSAAGVGTYQPQNGEHIMANFTTY